MKLSELQRKLRAFAYFRAPKWVKKARNAAFQAAIAANLRHEPYPYYADQPN